MEGGTVVMSAVRKSSMVTGSGRKIKDNAADWHNLMKRWDKLNDEGFDVATNIVNLRRSQSDHLLLENSSSSSSSSSAQQVGGVSELEDECFKLQEVINKMVAVVTKMEHLMKLQQGIEDLEEFQFKGEGRKAPLFHTWNTKQFGAVSRVLFDSFSEELKLKQTILQELAHTSSSDLCMVYLSSWLHQPFIPTHTRLTLEALLLETGHRPL
ncbi:cyclin-dependent kinase 2-interacting protein isoform 2-T2 [Pholidichthys leucotaenia]